MHPFAHIIFGIFFAPTIFSGHAFDDEKLKRVIYLDQANKDNKNPSFEQVSLYFHLPLIAAAKELNICDSKLKKICRANKLNRWPYRKLRSIDKIITHMENHVESHIKTGNSQDEIKNYENIKNYILNNLNTPYSEIIKKAELNKLNSQISQSLSTACVQKKVSDKRAAAKIVLKEKKAKPIFSACAPNFKHQKSNSKPIFTNLVLKEADPHETEAPLTIPEAKAELKLESLDEIETDTWDKVNPSNEAPEKCSTTDQNDAIKLDPEQKKEFNSIKEECRPFIHYKRIFDDNHNIDAGTLK